MAEDAVAEDAVAGDAVAGDAVPSDEQQPADEEVPAPAEPLPPEPAAEPDEPAPPTSGLDSIFARLREPQEEPPPAVAATPTLTPEVAEEEQPADAPPAAQDEPAPESAPAEPVASPVDVDAFDIRDRLLLPIENRALRSVKRRIVDLQNRVLEELRVGGDEWLPDRAMLAAAVGDEMATLAAESHVAGHTAAADLAGSGTTPRPERGPSGDDSGAFVDALERAVGESLSRTRSAGGGARQTSAGVSRVFRAWRTDEAERRLRHAARRSYHEGVLAGLALLEVSRVVALADGQPCGECPAESGAAWRPDGELPEGFKLPPAGPGCSATIVPAA